MPRSKQISFIVKISACLVTFCILFFTTTVFPADVTLTWEKPNDPRVTGYKIFYGPADTDFKSTAKEIINSSDLTSCNILSLTVGSTYGFAAKSFDKNDNESDFSEVLYYDVPLMKKEGSSGSGGCFIRMVLDFNILKHQ